VPNEPNGSRQKGCTSEKGVRFCGDCMARTRGQQKREVASTASRSHQRTRATLSWQPPQARRGRPCPAVRGQHAERMPSPTWDAHLFPGSPIDSVHSTVTAWSLTCCHLDGRLDRHQPPGFLILHSHNHTEPLMPRSPTRRQTLSGACVRNRILRSLWALSPFSVSAAAFSSSS
jgi:hypothetical protein